MGFQITLFLTLAIYTTQFQEELPVWKNIGETPLLANTVIVCIVSKYNFGCRRLNLSLLKFCWV